MFSKILILADQKSKRFLHKELLSGIKLDSEFILVKSFEQALEVIRKEDLSLIVLDNEVDDPGKHRKRKEAILELK